MSEGLSKGAASKLQRLIDKAARTGAEAHRAVSELMDWCADTYGAEPGDVDADSIIDCVLGGDGVPSSMPAEEFDEIMRSLT